MKIVIATPFYPPEVGVLGTYAAGVERALRQLGHEAVVVSLGPLKGLPSGVSHLFYFLKLLVSLRGATFLLALDTWSVGVPAFYATHLMHIPFLIRIGGDLVWEAYIERTQENVRVSDFYAQKHTLSLKERVMFRMTKKMLRGARSIMFNTRFQKEIWQHAYEIPQNTVVLENYYPPKEVYEAPTNRVFVCATRGAYYKNTALFKKVFARVKEKFPLIELDDRVEAYDAQLRRLARAYAVVIPSISEVGSNTAIEAVARGRPFITTEDTGTRERLGDCGIFVDTRDETALEKAIESMLEPATYERLVENAQKFEFTHSWEEIATEILKEVTPHL